MIDLSKKRIKLLIRRNLKMEEKKISAQCVHAAFGLAGKHSIGSELCAQDLFEWANTTAVRLDASDKKYEEIKAGQQAVGNPVYIFHDSGYTESEPRIETSMAFLEDNPKVIDATSEGPICTRCHKPIQVECAFGNCKPEDNRAPFESGEPDWPSASNDPGLRL